MSAILNDRPLSPSRGVHLEQRFSGLIVHQNDLEALLEDKLLDLTASFLIVWGRARKVAFLTGCQEFPPLLIRVVPATLGKSLF